MDEQRNNQEKLRQHDRNAAHYPPPVLLPRSGYSVFDDTAGWQIAFGKAPSLELPPVEHVNIGSRRFRYHLRRSFAVQDLNRCIGGYFSGLRPTHNITAHRTSSNVGVRHRVNRRCRSGGQLSHYVKRKIAVPGWVATVCKRQHDGLSGQAGDDGKQFRNRSIADNVNVEIRFTTELFTKLHEVDMFLRVRSTYQQHLSCFRLQLACHVNDLASVDIERYGNRIGQV